MAKAKKLTLYKARGGRKPCPLCGKLHDPDLDLLATGFMRAITLLMTAHDSGDVTTEFARKSLRAGLRAMIKTGVKLVPSI